MSDAVKKAIVAKISFGTSEIDGLMFPDGSFGIALSQAWSIIEEKVARHSNLLRQSKALLGKDFQPFKAKTELNANDAYVITLDQLFDLTLALYNKKPLAKYMEFACELGLHLGKDVEGLKILHKHNKNKTPRKDTKATEKDIQLAYQARLGGKIEVSTPLGNIDLLTDKGYLYEFKHYRGFKEALGQVLVYSRFVETKKKFILLFGCPKNYKYLNQWQEMKKVCEDYGITLLGLQ